MERYTYRTNKRQFNGWYLKFQNDQSIHSQQQMASSGEDGLTRMD